MIEIEVAIQTKTKDGVFSQGFTDPYPWELTFEEFVKYMLEHTEPRPERTAEYEARLRKSHQGAVSIALKQGLGATAKALAEYPDILTKL